MTGEAKAGAEAGAPAEWTPGGFETAMEFELAVWRPGYALFRAPLRPQHLNRNGAPHGGVVAALLDGAGMYAGNLDPASGLRRKAVTVSMSCNYVGAAKGDMLVCEGRLLKAGRSTFFAEARLTDGEGGPLLATGQGAYKYVGA